VRLKTKCLRKDEISRQFRILHKEQLTGGGYTSLGRNRPIRLHTQFCWGNSSESVLEDRGDVRAALRIVTGCEDGRGGGWCSTAGLVIAALNVRVCCQGVQVWDM